MSARVLVGDVREQIRTIPDGSVDAIITSPPFLALRKYGDNPGAEMGSEATPAAFLDALLELTTEFRRVLAPHGSIALELGDTYSGSPSSGQLYDTGEKQRAATRLGTSRRAPKGGADWPLDKSLCLTPFAYPMALAYGHNPLTGEPSPAGRWRVRNMIVWCRPNPPVGRLGDKVRPGTSYITVACTSGRRWFDLDAVRTEGSPNAHLRGPKSSGGLRVAPRQVTGSRRDDGQVDASLIDPAGAPPLDWWGDDYDTDDLGHIALILNTLGYKGAHHAVWPKTLARRLIEMLCPPGGTVLDPFAGSGTTLAVATGCGREAIGIELYADHAALILERCGLFLDLAPPTPPADVVVDWEQLELPGA